MHKKIFIHILANILSAISVVILHANGSFWNYKNDYSWALNNVVECIFYFAVPVFFMITGATLIDYTEKYDTKTFFKKRFTKTTIPFLFWSMLALFKILMNNPKYFLRDELKFDKVFNGIFNTQYLHVFWFFIPLFCIYLQIPLFASIEKDKKLKILNYLSCVAFFINVLIPFGIKVVNALFRWRIEYKFELSVLSEYIFYTVVGYLLHKYTLSPKKRFAIYVFSILGLTMHLFGTYYLSRKHGEVNLFFKGYTNLPCVLYSIGVFVFVKYLVERYKLNTLQSLIVKLQGYTFEIYLLHMFIYEPICIMLTKLDISNTSQLFVLLMTIISIPICIVITIILRKMPFLKCIVP